MKQLNNVKTNIITILIIEVLCLIIAFTVDYSGAGTIAVFLKWLPAFVGLGTLLLYFVSKFFTEKYNWIITIIGISLMIGVTINLHLTNYSV